MALNPNLILAGSPVNVLGALNAGTVAAGNANAVQRENALAGVYRVHGAGILAGQPEALNALAGQNPQAALNVRNTIDDNRRADADLRMRAEAYARTLSAAEAAAEAKRTEDAVKMGMAIEDAPTWDAVMSQKAPELVGMFDQRNMLANQFMTVAEILKQRTPDQTEAEQEIARLQSIGIPRDLAIRIKEGVLRVTQDPVTREVSVIDVSDGRVVYGGGNQAPATGPASAPPATNPDAFPAASQSFGLGGTARGIANTAADVVGAPVPFEGVQETQADFAVLKEQLTSEIANGYGRQPPSWLMQRIQDLIPEAGSPTQGASGAQAKLRALQRTLEIELGVVDAQLAELRIGPAMRQELQARRSALASAGNRVNTALQSFSTEGGGQTSGTTAGGIRWEITP